MISPSDSSKPGMSPYEAHAWTELAEFWQRKADRRRLPPRAEQAKDAATAKIKDAAAATGKTIANRTPQAVKDAGGLVIDRALEPASQAVLGVMSRDVVA